MKKLTALFLALILCLGVLNYSAANVNAKTTCKKSKYTIVCYYYKGSSKSYYKKITTKKYKNGKRKYREYAFRNAKGVRTQTKRYYYNYKGQLKSNNNGRAKRIVYYYYSNNKVRSRTTHNYNYRGKLKNKKVKYYTGNKPKAPTNTCSWYKAYNGNCVLKSDDANKDGILDIRQVDGISIHATEEEAMQVAGVVRSSNNLITGKTYWYNIHH